MSPICSKRDFNCCLFLLAFIIAFQTLPNFLYSVLKISNAYEVLFETASAKNQSSAKTLHNMIS